MALGADPTLGKNATIKRARVCMSMAACPNSVSERGTLSNSVSSTARVPHAMHGGDVDLGPLAMQVGHNGMEFSGPHVSHGRRSVGTGGSLEAVGSGTVRVGVSQPVSGWAGGGGSRAVHRPVGQAPSTAEQRMEALKVRIRAKNAMICTDDLC